MYKKHLQLTICSILFYLGSFAQLQTDNSFTPTELVNDVLSGSCVDIFNISYTGHDNSIGKFNGTSSNIRLDSGILITTGTLNVSIGPNDNTGAGNDNGLPGDSSLTDLAGVNTHNAAILEFDFIPKTDTVRFRYVFGSEEYHEYVCSQYNDVFAFFISGPGYAGQENIALIPGTVTPVAINTVNNGTPAGIASNCDLTNTAFFVDNESPPGNSIQYDGFTVVMEAKAVVTACSAYHIKIAIADAGDGVYDSGVFLEAESFSSGDDITVTAENEAIEQCSNSRFIITRNDGDISDSLIVRYNISGSATNGTDYTVLPDSIIIPAGQDTVHLNIYASVDTLTEGEESIIINLLNSCYCTNPSDSLIIYDYEPVNVSASPDTLICEGDAVPLIADVSGRSGLYNISWDNGAGSGDTVWVSPLITTTYKVTVNDTCGLSAEDSITITVDSPFNITAGPDTTICTGEQVQLFAGGGISYSWKPSGTLNFPDSANPVATPFSSTVYYVTGKAATGCESTDSVMITVTPPLSTEPDSINMCKGDTTTLTATGSISYLWLSADKNDTLSADSFLTVYPDSTVSYLVYGTDGICSKIDTVYVIIDPPMSIDAGNNVTVCKGTGTTLNTTGGENHIWSPPVNLSCTNCTSPFAYPSSTTTYYVSVSDSAGNCRNTDSVSVIVTPDITIELDSSDLQLCQGDTAVISVSGAENYVWLNTFTRDTLSNDSFLIAAPGELTTYTILSRDSFCERNDNFTISVTGLPEPSLNDDTICSGESITLSLNGSYSNPVWSNGDTTLITTVNQTGDYFVIVDSAGCTGTSDTAFIFVKNVQAFTSSDTSICLGNSIQLTASGGNQYNWYPETGLSAPDISNPVASPDNSLNYNVIVTDTITGCNDTNNINITVTPEVFINPDSLISEICRGDTATLKISGDNQYFWIDPFINDTLGMDSVLYISPEITTEYHLISYNGSCTRKDTFPVTVNPLPQPNLQGDTICPGGAALLTPGKNYSSYEWSTGSNSELIIVSEPGSYFVLVDSFGCKGYSDTVTVGFHTMQIFAGNDTIIQLGEEVLLHASGGTDYSWSPSSFLSCINCQSPYSRPERNTSYTVTVSDSLTGCKKTDTINIIVDIPKQVYIPGGFTPNKDGDNDLLFVRGTGIINIHLMIYDRWGERVFESKDINKGWDGTYKGKKVSSGVYIYYLKVFFENSSETIYGNITLIR